MKIRVGGWLVLLAAALTTAPCSTASADLAAIPELERANTPPITRSPATLVLSAGFGPYDQPLFSDVDWELVRLGVAAEASPATWRSAQACDEVELDPGRYRVVARHGDMRIERELDLRASETRREHIRFGSGQLALRAIPSAGAPPISEPVSWSMHRVDALGRVDDEPLYAALKATWRVELETGRYEVRARYGDAASRWTVSLEPGVLEPHTVVLDADTRSAVRVDPPE